MSEPSGLDALRGELDRYKSAVEALESLEKGSPDAKPRIMEVLVSRDRLGSELDAQKEIERERIPELFEIDSQVEGLDDRLKKQGRMIAGAVNLEKWRDYFKPAETAWWWNFEPPPDPWDRFDWAWSAVTAVVLALAASFMLDIYRAVSMESASVASTFSMIAQIAGLAAIGSGALSQRGKQVVRKILSSLNISPRYFAEATFLAALILLGIVYLVDISLDDYFFEKGQAAYAQGALSDAEKAFLQGLKASPDNAQYFFHLGQVYESLGNLDKAIDNYRQAAENGIWQALGGMGRAFINRVNPVTEKADPALGEAYLLLCLERAQTQNADEPILYSLNRDIAWALLKQNKLDRAEAYLEDALILDAHLEGDIAGRGMGYCFMAEVQKQKNNLNQANAMWRKCLKNARPEFIHEYKWLMDVKQDKIAYCVDTRHVISGYKEKRTPDADHWCEKVYNELGEALETAPSGQTPPIQEPAPDSAGQGQ